MFDVDAFVDAMAHVRPTCKNVVVIFSSGLILLEQQAQALRDELEARNISCNLVHVDGVNSVYDKARARISKNTDMVVILRDYVTNSSLQTLVRICSETGSTLFASDAHSVEQGAAAGYCLDEYEIGLLVGEHAAKVLKAPEAVRDIPMMYLQADQLCSLHVNPFAMKKQGIQTSLKDFLMKKGM